MVTELSAFSMRIEQSFHPSIRACADQIQSGFVDEQRSTVSFLLPFRYHFLLLFLEGH